MRPETKDGPNRTLHRDLLLPCGFLPASTPDQTFPSIPVRRPKTRSHVSRTSPVDLNGEEGEDDDDFVWILHYLVSTANPEASSNPKDSSSVLQPQIPQPYLSIESPTKSAQDGELCYSLSSDNSPEPVGENVPEHVGENLLTSPERLTSNGTETLEQPKEVPANDAITPETDLAELATSLRRSNRSREPPNRLQYTQLGNPLAYMVQALFHGLSSVFADTL